MKLEAFQTLAAVVAEGSFAAAAHARHMTPSAVSMQMKQLEQYVGKPLFDRSGQHVRPRPAALELVGTMEPALSMLEALRRRPGIVVEGHLRVGIIEALQPILLPAAMLYLREYHPRLTIAPQRGTSAALTDEVKAGGLDAAIVARPQRGLRAGLHWAPLASQSLVFIAPPGGKNGARDTAHRPLGTADLTSRMRAMDWIRYDRATTTGGMATRYVQQLVPGKRSLVELGSAAAIVAMVSAGLGFSVLQLIDRRLTDIYPVDVWPLPKGGPVFELGVVTRQVEAEDRPQQAWREAVQHALASATGASPPKR
ncbi:MULTISPECIES: LysR family transcriptional regulator [unclassified Achromobacter]|uniref:LysR family transcriptional regulator n=1 Tax=unclassified Achromobacter TaxID=2626865 RepID=UPI000B51D420|nr:MULTISPECIES: LysR family transcriptional regulator [unclassified Achromobacter]OWT71618.1 LysR family transcriptional regulator [Achromobacter sp. HZ34]OWT73275.1 LysR family transcriptional regulator [Achromobacter sp. HZ28]